MEIQGGKTYLGVIFIIIGLLCMTLSSMSLAKQVAANQHECIPTEVEFISEVCTDSTCNWSYEICQEGYGLSHWDFGICVWLVDYIVEVGYVNGEGTQVILSQCPVETEDPCWSYGYDSTTGLTGLKWDDLPGPENECWTFYLVLSIDLPEEELEWASKFSTCTANGTVIGPACSIELGGITAFKYYDENNNGEYDDNDYGLENWEICLESADNGNPICKMTDETGLVNFEALPAGTYVVSETLQAGWTNTDPGTFPTSKEVTVQEGEQGYVEFGNWKSTPPPPDTPESEIVSHEAGIDVTPVDKIWLLIPWLGLAGLLIAVAGLMLLLKLRLFR